MHTEFPASGGPDEPFESLLEAFLEAVSLGSEPDPRQLATTLGSEHERARFVGTALAHEVLWRRERGETTSVEGVGQLLEDDVERAAFAEVLASGELARRALPPPAWAPEAIIAGHYRLLGRIGGGGMGAGSRARPGLPTAAPRSPGQGRTPAPPDALDPAASGDPRDGGGDQRPDSTR